jgi:cytochrome c oxidase assembly protein subunit 15
MTSLRNEQRRIAWWLLICCVLVFGMVVLGGVTRLTGSGLSMVDWRPVLGWLPPTSAEKWQATFELYQQSPEFKTVNQHMDVEAFKGIFWLEYLHRLLGRSIGIVFLVPFLWFLYRRSIPGNQVPKYLLMFVLGGLQGVLGWFMVKSGLVNDPHVSQYRLTAHLMAAFGIFAYMFWIAMGLLAGEAPRIRHRWFGRTRGLLLLITVTIVSGGFVAGLKAGTIYNTFPMMGDYWIPPGLLALEPLWRNFFDNMVTVQFDHRLLAVATFAAVVAYWVFAIRGGLPRHLRSSAHGLLAVALVQVALGISTLLQGVPIALASAHQAVAMVLFTIALYLTHGLTRETPGAVD